MGFDIHVESSFLGLLEKEAPHLLPLKNAGKEAFFAPHGTTILAIKYNGGVLAAGDKRALAGYDIFTEVEKVYKIDDNTIICIAGTAGPALELVEVVRTQVKYFNRKNGYSLPLKGKLNTVRDILKFHFSNIMGSVSPFEQPVIVSPLFVHYDSKESRGRIYFFDITGAYYETEENFRANGSGIKEAGSYLGTHYRDNLTKDEAVILAREAIKHAAEKSVATGKESSVKIITEAGVSDIEDQ